MANILRKGLNFDFKSMGEQSSIIDPIIDFTRSSTATRISPISGLVETIASNIMRNCGRQELWKAGSKNLISHSNDLTNGVYLLNPDTVTPIQRTLIGDESLLTPVTADPFLYRPFSISVAGDYTLSMTLRNAPGATRETVQVNIRNDAGWTLVGSSASPTLTSIKTRLVITRYLAAGNYMFLIGAGSSFSSSGGGLLVSDIQLELGATATAYEPNPVVIQPGLLIEGAATNLLGYSEDLFGNSQWTADSPFNSIVTGQADPKGTNTAMKYIPSSNHSYLRAPIYLTGTYVFSVWLMVDSGVVPINLAIRDSGYTPVGGGSALVTTSWQRFYVTTGASITTADILIGTAPTWTNQTLYAWGAQLETGTFPSSYIPTAGAPVTRAADNASIDVSKIWNANGGTLLVEGDPGPSGQQAALLDGYGAERVLFDVVGVGQIRSYLNGNVQTVSVGQRARLSLSLSFPCRFGGNGGALASNGSIIPQPIKLTLGAGNGGQTPLNGTLQRLIYAPYAMDDLTLKALSELQ